MKKPLLDDYAPIVYALLILIGVVVFFAAMGKAQQRNDKSRFALIDKAFSVKEKSKDDKANAKVKSNFSECSRALTMCQRRCRSLPVGSEESVQCANDCFGQNERCMR